MDRDITPERVMQMIALYRDQDSRAEKMLLDLDPWQKDEMLWKLLHVTALVLDDAAAVSGITGDQILWNIITTIKEINDERS